MHVQLAALQRLLLPRNRQGASERWIMIPPEVAAHIIEIWERETLNKIYAVMIVAKVTT